MQTLLIAVLSAVGFIVAYNTYGRWLARKLFKLDPDAIVPSVALNDNKDFVPTSKGIVFGHHFTSIAGTGPIVGPAIGVMWGWLPALLWVVFGSILIGAVHDFGALVVSMRNRGQTVGDIAGRMINSRVRVLFLLVLFLSLTIVLAIFGLVVAAVFRMYPSSIFPCLIQVPLAIAIGLWLHRKGLNLLIPSIIALVLMYASVLYGDVGPLGAFNAALQGWTIMAWVTALLVYSYVASVLPVWLLLQPRDYIHSLQLISALGLIVLGLVVAAFMGGAPIEGVRPSLEIIAPMASFHPADAPLIIPFLFITIACGAISGFHCLVSSGTSSKQIKCESDAQFIGYGSMLTEGFLATLVILACVAGLGLGIPGEGGTVLTGTEAWSARYASWSTAAGLGAKVGAFVDGAANFLKALGVPASAAIALMGVLVASFAGTTMDTACRLQRYVVQELARALRRRDVSGKPVAKQPLDFLTNKHAATLFAIVTAGLLAALPKPGAEWTLDTAGTGGLILWPLFGATNQLLSGLAFLVIAFWLWRRGKPVWMFILPMVLMLIMPAWAMIWQMFVQAVGSQNSWLADGKWLLMGFGFATLALEAWMVTEAVLIWPKVRSVMEEPLPNLPRSGGSVTF